MFQSQDVTSLFDPVWSCFHVDPCDARTGLDGIMNYLQLWNVVLAPVICSMIIYDNLTEFVSRSLIHWLSQYFSIRRKAQNRPYTRYASTQSCLLTCSVEHQLLVLERTMWNDTVLILYEFEIIWVLHSSPLVMLPAPGWLADHHLGSRMHPGMSDGNKVAEGSSEDAKPGWGITFRRIHVRVDMCRHVKARVLIRYGNRG
jgi:hypothetical protein